MLRFSPKRESDTASTANLVKRSLRSREPLGSGLSRMLIYFGAFLPNRLDRKGWAERYVVQDDLRVIMPCSEGTPRLRVSENEEKIRCVALKSLR